MVGQDEIEFVRRAKYELEQMMLVLKRTKFRIRISMNCMSDIPCGFENFVVISIKCQ
jgi:hypothetical protein